MDKTATTDQIKGLDRVISPAGVVKMLATKGIQISERELRRRAREIGAYRQIGRAMFFLPEDLDRIMTPVSRPSSSMGRKGRSRSYLKRPPVSGLSEARATLARLKQEDKARKA